MTFRGLFEPQDGIVRRRPTRWLHPMEVLRAAFHALFASTIAGYIDRREFMAALPRITLPQGVTVKSRVRLRPDGPDVEVIPSNRDLWIDFIADIGDGFDATYGMGTLLAREELALPGLERPLPRADIVVLGGDLVYPTPGRDQYKTRLQGPLEAAFPGTTPLAESPSVFAIPGNHDWYDGLTNFVRVFCQGGTLGAWRMWQSRSYFALKLPGRWWLWGTDIQLSTRIDPSQIAHFMRLCRKQAPDAGRHSDVPPRLQEGDRVILCTGKPSWYRAERPDKSFRDLDFFEWATIRQAGAHTAIALSGDVHHYARFADRRGRQKITSGSGGAYLSATHLLPRLLRIPERTDKGTITEEFVESGFTYPGRDESRRLLWGTLRLPFLAANAAFCLMLGLLYALMHLVLEPETVAISQTLGAYLGHVGLDLRTMPLAILLPIVVLLATGLFTRTANSDSFRGLTWAWGVLHGATHVCLALVLGWTATTIAARIGVVGWQEPYFVAAMVTAVGTVVGGFLFAVYLFLSTSLWGWHQNESFLAQGIVDYRSFIRMKLEPDGRLTIYPIGVRRIPRRWRRRTADHADPKRRRRSPEIRRRAETASSGQAGAGGDPAEPSLLESADHFDLEPHLIEGPIELPPDPEPTP